jgi:hypothetical protein
MKTSKIIFFSLLGTIALLILAAFIDVRLTGYKNTGAADEISINDTTVSTFSVLMVNNCQALNIINGSSPAISIECFEKTKPAEIKYDIRNDTLFISDIEYSEARNIRLVNLKITGSVKRVMAKNSHFRISQTASDELWIDADKSNIFMYGDTSGNSRLRKLSINAINQSYVSSNNVIADSVLVSLRASKAGLMIKVEKIMGTITSESRLTVTQPNDISLKTDATSHLYINQFER